MKIITIGRDEESTILIDDDLISLRHAIIRLLPFGKMEIKDLSKNGTFINGVRIAPNKFVPIKRKDVVSFAKVTKLDWKDVPDNMRVVRIWAFILGALLAAWVAIVVILSIDWSGKKAAEEIREIEENVSVPQTPGNSGDASESQSEVGGKTNGANVPSGSDMLPKKKQSDKGVSTAKEEKDSIETAKETETTEPDDKKKDSKKVFVL